jgi:hypothetical protein
MKKILALIVALLAISLLFTQLAMADVVFAFEKASNDVFIGKTVKTNVVAQGTDEKLTYNWESSDDGIATVKNGTVKGVSKGSVTIKCTATSTDGETYTASCTINVNIPVKSIKVADKKVELAPGPFKMVSLTEGETAEQYYMFTPTVTIEPEDATNKDIEWSSSDVWIASVTQEGIVTGGSYGTATITGKAMDGSGKTVSYKVTVPMCFVTADSLTITEESGATLGYIFASVSGLNMYSEKVKGDCFSIEGIYDNDDDDTFMDKMTMYRIVPVKVGSGSITFIRNGRQLKTVKIKVEKSAVRDDDSYPKVDISDVIALKDAYTGKHVQFPGTLLTYEALKTNSFVYPDVNDDYEGEYSGIAYAYVEGASMQYFAFEYSLAASLTIGSEYTIYGTIDHYVTYTTDTGLSYEAPYLINVSTGN